MSVASIPPKGVVPWAPPCCGIPTHCEADKAEGGQGRPICIILFCKGYKRVLYLNDK